MRLAVLALLIALTAIPAGALGAAPPTAIECLDYEDVYETSVTAPRAIQGGAAEVVVIRKEEHAAVPASGLSLTVAGGTPIALAPPEVGVESRTTIRLPRQRTFGISIAWGQGTGFFECIGRDNYRVRAFAAPAALRTYLGRVQAGQRSWERSRRALLACLEDVDASSVADVAATARCLERVRSGDRTLRLYRRITPPPGLEADHRGLVESAAIRARVMAQAASFLRRATRGLRGELVDLTQPEFASGTQRRRALWRRAIAVEARGAGVRLPPWLQKVGQGPQERDAA